MKKTVPPVAEAPAWEEELPVRVQEAFGGAGRCGEGGVAGPCRSVSASASSPN